MYFLRHVSPSPSDKVCVSLTKGQDEGMYIVWYLCILCIYIYTYYIHILYTYINIYIYSTYTFWHPCVHSAEKLCPLNRLQTQPYTTKWRLNLNQPPLLQNGLGVFMVDQKPMSVTTKWLCVPILYGMTGKRGLWGFRYDTTINHYKMHFRFLSAKWNAATRYSARPFTTKTGARVHFLLEFSTKQGMVSSTCSPF